MARVTEHFAEGWQKTGQAKHLREVRQDHVEKERGTARQMMDKLASTETSRPDAPNADHQARQTGGERPATQSTASTARPEVQHEASRGEGQRVASQSAQHAKVEAHSVEQSVAHPDVATREAVVQRNPAAQTNLPQNGQQQSSFSIVQANRMPHAQPAAQASSRARPSAADQTRGREDDARPNAQRQINPDGTQPHANVEATTATLQAGLTPNGTASNTDETTDSNEPKDRDRSVTNKSSHARTAGAYARHGAGSDLSRLECGVSAGGEGEERDLESPETPVVNEIPERYAATTVFNSENADVDTVMEKSSILNRFVYKSVEADRRIEEIHALDQRVTDLLAGRVVPLSERIVSDVEGNLNICTADFLRNANGRGTNA